MTQSDPAPRSVIIAMFRTVRLLRQRLDSRARDIGLSYARGRALGVITRNEGATQAEVALMLGIEAPTLKRQLDALEADGFITRCKLPNDGRKHALFLTDKGRDAEILAHLRPETLLAGIPEQDIATTLRVLAQVEANAGVQDNA